jgi:hypothetical protein
MTAIFPFTPSSSAIVQFQPTLTDLEGNTDQYTATVTWSLYGVRWYFNLAQLNGTPIVSRPLIATPVARNLQSLTWANSVVTAVTIAPHGWKPLLTIPLTIAGCAPDAYNGAVSAFVTGVSVFQWPLVANPGAANRIGTASYDVNLAGGYFASSILFRNNQFEVSP